MAEGGEAPGLEDQLVALAHPFTGLDQFFPEQARVEADLLENLLAELHHLLSLIHHHDSGLAGLKVVLAAKKGNPGMVGFSTGGQGTR